jgi:Tc5 transposase DNA-binding domain
MVRSAPRMKKTVDDATEAKIKKAAQDLKDGIYKKMTDAAKAYNIPYHTMRRRCLGKTAPKKEAHKKQLLLSPSQEETLVEWIQYLGITGHPVNRWTVCPMVQSMLPPTRKRTISKSWIHRFTARHEDLKLGRGSGLDPKRARAFNFSTVQHHFQLLKSHMEEHGIPWENVYNMDEKGIQLGGGRKGTGLKFFFAKTDMSQYKLKSDDLQLVTVIEVVCADGTSTIKPGFVFQGSTKCPEWFCEPGVM